MRNALFLISLALSSGACSDASEYREKVAVAEKSAVPAKSAAPARAAPAAPGAIAEDSERFTFSYAWPKEAGAEPALAALLTGRAKSEQAALRKQADEEWASAAGGEYEPRPHSYEQEWTVVTDVPGFLSLAGRWNSYAGGAHGLYGLESLVWDRRTQRALNGVDLFRSPDALARALGPRLCSALNQERAKRRGQPVDPASDSEFDACPGMDEAVILLGSAGGTGFDRIGVYFGPYVAGSYAEGEYELNFPIDGAVLRAVRPQFRAAFAPPR